MEGNPLKGAKIPNGNPEEPMSLAEYNQLIVNEIGRNNRLAALAFLVSFVSLCVSGAALWCAMT